MTKNLSAIETGNLLLKNLFQFFDGLAISFFFFFFHDNWTGMQFEVNLYFSFRRRRRDDKLQWTVCGCLETNYQLSGVARKRACWDRRCSCRVNMRYFVKIHCLLQAMKTVAVFKHYYYYYFCLQTSISRSVRIVWFKDPARQVGGGSCGCRECILSIVCR